MKESLTFKIIKSHLALDSKDDQFYLFLLISVYQKVKL